MSNCLFEAAFENILEQCKCVPISPYQTKYMWSTWYLVKQIPNKGYVKYMISGTWQVCTWLSHDGRGWSDGDVRDLHGGQPHLHEWPYEPDGWVKMSPKCHKMSNESYHKNTVCITHGIYVSQNVTPIVSPKCHKKVRKNTCGKVSKCHTNSVDQ